MFTARFVPNMYLFGTFSAQNPPKSRHTFNLAGAARRSGNDPSLQALRRAAEGWVEEYGHLPACDATVGAFDAKNGVSCDRAA